MKTKLWTAPLALALAVGACDEMLVETPTAFLTTETYYKTAEDLDTGMQSAYNSMRAIFHGNSFQWWGTIGRMSDQERADPTEVTQGINNPDMLFWTAEAPVHTDVGWEHLFRTIYRVNLVISRAADVQMDEGRKAQLIAEAKFLRAFSYFALDRAYSAGGEPTDLSVPLLLDEKAHAGSEFPRATTAEVHAAIIKDLTEAEAALPTRAQRGAAGRGRATKGAAQILLADVYLWRSSFLQQNEWKQASDWARKLMDSGDYGLVESGYFNIWNPSAKANNNEQIFFLVTTGNAGRATSGFVNTHYPRSLGFNTGGGWGTNQVTEWMLNSYIKGDVRGAVGPTDKPGSSPTDSMAYRNYGCSTTASIGCREVWPMPYKFRPTKLHAGEGDVDVPFYRFAEALLIYAEAQYELGNQGESLRALNMIRARARKGATGTENRAQPADLTSVTRDAIYMERNWELAHETKRWWDLVRRDSMEPGFWFGQLSKNDPRATQAHPDLAQRTYLKRFPVPQRQIDNNPALVQNPGY